MLQYINGGALRPSLKRATVFKELKRYMIIGHADSANDSATAGPSA